MNSPAASTSALSPVENHDTDRISAYYSLAFPNFTYYLQTPTVTIGRRPIPSSSASSSDLPLIDVDLGPLKSVSRLHARIEYEEEDEIFVLVVLGRNGAWVDGIWAPSGSRVPLGARSQIQIATRTFHFVLPPPDPEATPFSPPPSTARDGSRSPSVDITDLSPGPSKHLSPLPTSNVPPATSKASKPSKKRKRPEPEHHPPDKMPPKPLATYSVMCYRAITSLGGKASLQEVIQWMIENYEWYRLNAGGPWENSIRHNLSSNRAFCNAAKAGDEKGKGFLWGIDRKSEKMLQEQDAKAQQAELDRQLGRSSASSAAPGQPKATPPAKPVFTKEPLKLLMSKSVANTASVIPPKRELSASTQDVLPVVQPTFSSPNSSSIAPPPSAIPPVSLASSNTPISSSSTPPASAPVIPRLSSVPSGNPATVSLPIIVAPLPKSYHSSTAAAALASSSASSLLSSPPIVVHEGKLILSPAMFSHLTPKDLRELENMGTQKALEKLQTDLKRLLTAKMRSEGARARGKGRGRGRGRPPGRVAGNTSRKEGDTVSKSVGDGDVNATDSLQQSDGVIMRHGIGTNAINEEPAAKRQRLEEDSDAINMDMDVDIMGT